MKRELLLFATALAMAFPATAQRHDSTGVGAEHLPKNLRPPGSDAVSHDEFLARREAARKGSGFKQVPHSQAAKDAKPLPAGKRYDLMEMSTVVQGMSGTFTLVPKGAVLHVPAKLAERVASEPKGRFVLWGEFLSTNRAWIHTHEVDVELARGLKRLDEETLANFARKGLVVIATYSGNPISVNQPKSGGPATAAAEVVVPELPN